MKQLTFADTKPMTPVGRAEWLHAFGYDLLSAFILKFRAGQKEHQGDLGEVPSLQLLDEIWNEQLDQISYIGELKRRVMIGQFVIIDRDLLINLATIINQYVSSDHKRGDVQTSIMLLKQLLNQEYGQNKTT